MRLIKSALVAVTLICFTSVYGNSENMFSSTNVKGLSLSAWVTTDSNAEIRVAFQDSSGDWSSVEVLSDQLVCTNLRKPRTALDAKGNGVVVWIGLDPTLSIERLYGSMYVSGAWKAPQVLSAADEQIENEDFSVSIINGAVKVSWNSLFLSTFTKAIRSMYSPSYGTWSENILTISN